MRFHQTLIIISGTSNRIWMTSCNLLNNKFGESFNKCRHCHVLSDAFHLIDSNMIFQLTCYAYVKINIKQVSLINNFQSFTKIPLLVSEILIQISRNFLEFHAKLAKLVLCASAEKYAIEKLKWDMFYEMARSFVRL